MNRFKIVYRKSCNMFLNTAIVIRSEETFIEFIDRFKNDWNKAVNGTIEYVDEKGVAYYINTGVDQIIKIKEI